MATSGDTRTAVERVRLRQSPREEGGWELFAHGFDIGVRGFGNARDVAFEEAAYALTAAITDAGAVEHRDVVDVVCNAQSDDRLLHDWLNTLIQEMTARDMLFGRYSVQIRNHGLTGKAWGEKLDIGRHRPAVEVKSATTTELEVARDSDGVWIAQCVLDI